jgi:hypothetical protein
MLHKNKKNIILITLLIILVILTIYLIFKNITLNNKIMSYSATLNSKTDNLEDETSNKITEDEAIAVVEDYRINRLKDSTNAYKFVEIKQETVNIKSTYLANNDNYTIDIETSSINVYAIYYSQDDNMEKFTGYVDINSGKLIGIHGEGV